MRRRPTPRPARTSPTTPPSATSTTSRTRPSPASSGTGRRPPRTASTAAARPTAPTTRSGPRPGTTSGPREHVGGRGGRGGRPPRPRRPPRRAGRPGRRASRALDRHPRAQLGGLLGGPLVWLLVVYIGSLVSLLLTSLYTTNDFTGNLVKTVSLTNFRQLLSDPTFRTVTIRTIGIALAVTVIDLALALPIAFFMAKVASRRTRRALAVAIVLPLWASYLVKAYSWRVILDPVGGVHEADDRLLTRVRRGGHRAGAGLPVDALHGPAHLRRAREAAQLAAGRIGRPGGQGRAHVPVGGAAHAHALHRGRGHLHLLALAGRLHHRADRRGARPRRSAT